MILITGATGFLGTSLTLSALDAGRAVTAASNRRRLEIPGVHSVLADLAAPGVARQVVESVMPEWVINCAALADVDKCEANPGAATRANVELPRALATACMERGVRMLHVSTDSVFDGTRGLYNEGDEPRPLNMYAATKLAGEAAVVDNLPGAVVVRTNFIGIGPPPGLGLADWMVGRLERGERLTGFTDVVFSPLLATSLAGVMLSVVDAGLEGLYHASASDCCSKLDLAAMLADELGLDGTLIDESRLSDAHLAAPRPLNTSLSPARLEALLGPMPSVLDAVRGYARLRHDGFARRFVEAGVA